MPSKRKKAIPGRDQDISISDPVAGSQAQPIDPQLATILDSLTNAWPALGETKRAALRAIVDGLLAGESGRAAPSTTK